MKLRPNHYRAAAALSGLILGSSVAHGYGPPSALAGDDKIFAPQICVPLAPGTEIGGNALYRYDYVQQVETADYQTFICPLVRDVVTGDLDDIWIRVGNAFRNTGTPPECCTYRVSLLASSVDFECVTADDAVDRQILHIPGFLSSDIFDYGQYVVICELGNQDNIIGIRTSESD